MVSNNVVHHLSVLAFIPLFFVVFFFFIIIIPIIIVIIIPFLSQPTGFTFYFVILLSIPCGAMFLARVKSQQHSLKITGEEMSTHVHTYSRVHAGTVYKCV